MMSKICHLYHVNSSIPPQAYLSFMLLPLLSKKWLIQKLLLQKHVIFHVGRTHSFSASKRAPPLMGLADYPLVPLMASLIQT